MKVLVVKNGTFRAHFEGKNGSGSWIRTRFYATFNLRSNSKALREAIFKGEITLNII